MTTASLPRVAFVGLGTMGRPMAAESRTAPAFPFSLATQDSRQGGRTPRRGLSEGGRDVRAAATPAEASARRRRDRCRASRTRPRSRPSTSAPGGTAEGAAAGAARDRLFDDRRGARAAPIASGLGAKGLSFLDAPVSGGQRGPLEGTLTFFIGGDAAALEKGTPRPRGDRQAPHAPRPSGAGKLGKAANQILVANNLMAVAEALAFGAKAGLPLGPLHEALVGGAARSWALEVLGKKMIDRDFKPAFAVKHRQKDLAIVP